MMTTEGRKISKRACDACKIRKIKCTELPPCQACTSADIPCTFQKNQRIRGPRSLRAKTRDEIVNAQRRATISSSESTVPSPASSNLERINESSTTPNTSLTICLCVYRLRLFPVWPIISVEEIIASLHLGENNHDIYALANAIGAATIAQLKLDIAGANSAIGSKMAEECERVKLLIDTSSGLTPNLIRIAFFLHVFYENQNGGGVKSLMYLREAITMAQIMGLDREQLLLKLPFGEQQTRRRILWLLFVTERGVALLYRLPVILKPSTGFPSIDGEDESPIFVAVQKLVNLFFIFDQSGAFEILQHATGDQSDPDEIKASGRQCLESLRRRIQGTSMEQSAGNDVQRADICVTRQWMLAKIWAATRGGVESAQTHALNPISIAQEFLDSISVLPKAAIEAHGPTMEFKVYEIACTMIEAVAGSPELGEEVLRKAGKILSGLHQILSSIRGGNTALAAMLWSKVAAIRPGLPGEISSPLSQPAAQSPWRHQDKGPALNDDDFTSPSAASMVIEPSSSTRNKSNNKVNNLEPTSAVPEAASWDTNPTINNNPSRQPYMDFYPLDGIVGEIEPTDILSSFFSTGNPWEVFQP